jgi:selenocysteine-specific elongation factor
VASGLLVEDDLTLRLPTHEVRLSEEQDRRVDALLRRFAASPYAPPSVTECEEALGTELLTSLIEQGRLVKVGTDVAFLRETYSEMVDRITAYLKEHGSITVAQVRDMFGASRKYALALMEHLDERKVTRRVGDERVLR